MNNFNYNVTGEKRKELVRAMGEILGEDASYQGAPTFAYGIDGYTVSRDGLVTCPDTATHEDIGRLVEALKEKGFTPETVPKNAAPESIPENATDMAMTDDNTFTVEVPRVGFTEEAYGNLQKIIASKAALLKKAIGTDSLDIETSEDKLIFPWFTLHGLDGEADAYQVFDKDSGALHWIHTLISNAKSFLLGTYHGIGKKHLQRYFDEFDFRFNRRFWPKQLFPRLVRAVAVSNILGYDDLTR